MCQESDVQLFATTHSYECLRSLLPAMEENPEDFCLIRTEVLNGEHKVKQFYGRKFLAALEQQGEIR